jgi:hypothetical protein
MNIVIESKALSRPTRQDLVACRAKTGEHAAMEVAMPMRDQRSGTQLACDVLVV